MGEPADRVRLARAGRVLHHTRLSGAANTGIGGEAGDTVPLMEPGKDHAGFIPSPLGPPRHPD